jgi:hypothetical protein
MSNNGLQLKPGNIITAYKMLNYSIKKRSNEYVNNTVKAFWLIIAVKQQDLNFTELYVVNKYGLTTITISKEIILEVIQ